MGVKPVPIIACLLVCLPLGGCQGLRPQRGGVSTATLGGTSAPTVVTSGAPENPQTPTTTTVEKTTTREFTASAPELSHREHRAQAESAPSNASVPSDRPSVPSVSKSDVLVREVVSERATTQTGAAQKDTARELGARMANMRGVMWVGVLLLVGGPLVGWKLGWLTNGLIAGATGLGLIILAQVLPGNEAWLGLAGLGLMPLVAFVYYRAHHDARATPPSP